MDFLTDLFSALNTRDSLLVLLFLFIAFLIGMITGWLYWRRRLEDLRTRLSLTREDLARHQADAESRKKALDELESTHARTRLELDNCMTRLRDCQADRGQLTADLHALRDMQTTTPPSSGPDDLKRIRGIGPAIERKLHALGITTYSQISGFDSAAIDKITGELAFFPGRIERDNWVGQARDLMGKKQRGELSTPVWKPPTNPNDLKIVEGIGPAIEKLLHQAGIRSWSDLANTSNDQLQAILDAAGDAYRIHDPATWPRQAALAAGGEWSAFQAYTEFLKGGREPA